MTEKTVVRSVAQEDFAQWRDLWQGYNAFYGRENETTLADEITNRTWQRFFDPVEPVHALVAQSGEKLLGLAHYIFHRNTIMMNDTCYMQDLFVDQNARGLGVGGALINAVVDRAGAAGTSRVYWHTHETNAVAQKLYARLAERTGFIVFARKIAG